MSSHAAAADEMVKIDAITIRAVDPNFVSFLDDMSFSRAIDIDGESDDSILNF